LVFLGFPLVKLPLGLAIPKRLSPFGQIKVPEIPFLTSHTFINFLPNNIWVPTFPTRAIPLPLWQKPLVNLDWNFKEG